MTTLLNIILVVLVFATSVVQLSGETWIRGAGSLWKRILPRGWIAIALLALALCVGTAKELYLKHENMVEKEARKQEFDTLNSQLTDLRNLIAPADVRQPQVALSDKKNILDALAVRQTVRRDTTDKLNPYTITLQVDVSADFPDRADILPRISKVVYYLDPRWYSRPIVEVTNPNGGFRYSFGSFGSTQVTARIHLENPEEVVVRTGRISTSETQKFSTNTGD